MEIGEREESNTPWISGTVKEVICSLDCLVFVCIVPLLFAK